MVCTREQWPWNFVDFQRGLRACFIVRCRVFHCVWRTWPWYQRAANASACRTANQFYKASCPVEERRFTPWPVQESNDRGTLWIFSADCARVSLFAVQYFTAFWGLGLGIDELSALEVCELACASMLASLLCFSLDFYPSRSRYVRFLCTPSWTFRNKIRSFVLSALILSKWYWRFQGCWCRSLEVSVWLDLCVS